MGPDAVMQLAHDALPLLRDGMLLLLFVPLLLAVDTIISHAGDFADLARKLVTAGLPQPPDWVAGLPLVGEKLQTYWAQLADAECRRETRRPTCRL